MEFKWQHPEYLWLGPALFLLVLVGSWLFHRWRKKSWLALGLDPTKKVGVSNGFGSVRFFTRHILLALAVMFLGWSLANLQMGGQKQKVNRKGTDVVFALDVSRSMLAKDIAPSRLDKAKLLISRSLNTLGGDRVGIVAYAGSAYPALPITTDYVAAKMALTAATPDAVPSQGTNLSAALEYAFGYFNPASPAGRFVIILTDGEDHESLSQLDLPEFNVNIMLVGLGTQSGGPIPLRTTRRGTDYKKDKDGEVVITKRDEAQLAKMSNQIEAVYIDGNRTEKSLAAIEEFIASGDKASISEEIAIDYDPQFSWFLIPGVFFLFLYLMIPSKVGNPFANRKAAGIILLLLSSTLSFAQEADSLNLDFGKVGASRWEYEEAIRAGNKAAKNAVKERAARKFLEAAQYDPSAFEAVYNLGTTLHDMGLVEEADPVLRRAYENAETSEQRSDVLLNLGNISFDGQDYQQAINLYTESLKENPNQKDAIYNLNRAFEKLQNQDEQEQDQQNQEDEENQEQEQPEDRDDPKQDKDDPQEKDPEQDNAKDQQEQEQQSGQDGDENRDEQQNPNGQPEDQDGNDEKNQPEQGGDTKAKMTPEEIQGLLEAIQRAEEKTADKVNAKKAKGNKKSGDKDW